MIKETNMEHYRGEIEDVGYRFALVNGEIQKCIGTNCVQCSFYKFKFENCNGGRRGHSAAVGFYADGDGDFHPKFEVDTEYEIVKGLDGKDRTIEVLFDAG